MAKGKQATKKKDNKNKIALIIVLVLLAIAGVYAAITFARYITSATGTGTAKIAKWNIVLKKDGTTITGTTFEVDLAQTKDTNANVVSSVVAPGDKGSFTLNLSDTGTQVAYKYGVSLGISAFTATAGNIKFYSDAARSVPWTNIIDTVVPLTSAGSIDNSITIYWAWEAGETNNSNDTIAGESATSGGLGFTVTIVAEQITS